MVLYYIEDEEKKLCFKSYDVVIHNLKQLDAYTILKKNYKFKEKQIKLYKVIQTRDIMFGFIFSIL